MSSDVQTVLALIQSFLPLTLWELTICSMWILHNY